MTLSISPPVLPTFQECAMIHLSTLLAPQDLSLLSWLMSRKRKRHHQKHGEHHVDAHLKRREKAHQRFLKLL
jgi:hypothetical protein